MSEHPIQWFPGHMSKTKRTIQESLRLIDVTAEILDARIPKSSKNPLLDSLLGDRPRVILLNKSDMADSVETDRWIAWYREHGMPAIPVDCKSGKGLQSFLPFVQKVLRDKIDAWREKGMAGRRIRVMAVGIPNVGKSSFINRMAGTGRAKVEDRPGVTRDNQWFSIAGGVDLLDTPGVLWPKFENPSEGEFLAFTGAIKDQVFDVEAVAARLLQVLKAYYVQNLAARYRLDAALLLERDGPGMLELIGRKRGMLISGGEVDCERAANMILDEFRSGKLGRITLERAGA